MLDAYLVPEETRVTARGDSEPVEISGAAHRVFLLVQRITEVVEQEALDVSVFGSPDGTAWEPKPLLIFPQEFYRGQTPMLLDLSTQPDVRFLRAHWEAARWGRGPEQPMFVFDVKIREVPAEVWVEVQKSRHGSD